MAIDLGGPVYETFRQLRPPGTAWTSRITSVVQRLLAALADEYDRLIALLILLREEADPRTTISLLPDWESQYGLPEPCVSPPTTFEGRRDALVEKVTRKGGASRAYFIARAAAIGYTVTITEYLPWTCEDDCTGPIYGVDWIYRWDVNAPTETVFYFSAISECNQPLAWWGNEQLECLLNRIKPAHTILKFTYGL